MANKLGTLTEDILAPGLPTVFSRCFPEEDLLAFHVRSRRRHRTERGRMREFDIVLWGPSVFLLGETKSQLTSEDITTFTERAPEVAQFFPEVEGRRLVGALASFRLDPPLVAYGERQGLLMLGLGTGLLQVLNADGFVPRSLLG
jgi:hypothetical protein